MCAIITPLLEYSLYSRPSSAQHQHQHQHQQPPGHATGTVAPTSPSRLAPTQPASRSRSAATTRTYSIEPTLPRGVITNPKTNSRNTRLPRTTSHLAYTNIHHHSLLFSLFTPPLPHLADHRNSNLASNKPRQPLTHGNPRVIAPLPLLTPACLHLSQSHYHPRLSRPRQSYPHTHTTSTSTCIQLASHSAYCSILPSFSSTLAYTHIDPELPSLPDRPRSHASLHTTTPLISPYTQAVER